jgi:hypothetical protein
MRANRLTKWGQRLSQMGAPRHSPSDATRACASRLPSASRCKICGIRAARGVAPPDSHFQMESDETSRNLAICSCVKPSRERWVFSRSAVKVTFRPGLPLDVPPETGATLSDVANRCRPRLVQLFHLYLESLDMLLQRGDLGTLQSQCLAQCRDFLSQLLAGDSSDFFLQGFGKGSHRHMVRHAKWTDLLLTLRSVIAALPQIRAAHNTGL